MPQNPLVSIGMPLYNEGPYLQEALDSLLAQDYTNIEMVLSDNASTDQTPDICQAYAQKDKRINFLRHDTNIGARENFNGVVRRSQGTYFFWAAGHDRWDPTFIRKCVELLEQDPTIVLAYPQTLRMRADGTPIDVFPSSIDTRGLSASKRYRAFVWHVDCNLVYGVWHTEILKKSGLFQDVYAPDFLLLSEMSLHGAFAKVPEPLWHRRYQRPPETREEQKSRIITDLDPAAAKENINRPLVEQYRSLRDRHLALIKQSSLPWITKASLSFHTIAAFAVRCNVFPGATALKRVASVLLPAALKKKIVSWLRTG